MIDDAMLHHISLPVADLEKSAALYDTCLGELGYRRVCSGPEFAGYGLEDDKDAFALIALPNAKAAGEGFHLAFCAPSHSAIDAFHAAALRLGASDNGAPGYRPQYGASYYAAFFIDLDGHHIEAVLNRR